MRRQDTIEKIIQACYKLERQKRKRTYQSVGCIVDIKARTIKDFLSKKHILWNKMKNLDDLEYLKKIGAYNYLIKIQNIEHKKINDDTFKETIQDKKEIGEQDIEEKTDTCIILNKAEIQERLEEILMENCLQQSILEKNQLRFKEKFLKALETKFEFENNTIKNRQSLLDYAEAFKMMFK